jgi:hypothetical protein
LKFFTAVKQLDCKYYNSLADGSCFAARIVAYSPAWTTAGTRIASSDCDGGAIMSWGTKLNGLSTALTMETENQLRMFLKLILVAPVCCMLLGCSQKPTTFTVKIEQKGKDGAAVDHVFANSVNGVCNTAEDGDRQAHELFGTGNFSASFEGSFISCAASAKNASNTLIMTITKPDGSVVGTSQNRQPAGQVVVSGS